MSERDGRLPVPGPEVPDRPGVVEEADEVLTAYAWQLAGTAAVAIVGWIALAAYAGAIVPLSWLLLFLAFLLLLYVSPVSREPKLAKEVIRRWDELRVERALQEGGIADDPRREVARSMAERVLRHPSVDDRVRDTTRALVRRLEVLLKDLRRVEWLAEAPSAGEDRARSRSISDLVDILDARVASVLGQIAEIHRTVVLRDAIALERALDSVDDLLHRLEAEREVDRLLAGAEGTPGDRS